MFFRFFSRDIQMAALTARIKQISGKDFPYVTTGRTHTEAPLDENVQQFCLWKESKRSLRTSKALFIQPGTARILTVEDLSII